MGGKEGWYSREFHNRILSHAEGMSMRRAAYELTDQQLFKLDFRIIFASYQCSSKDRTKYCEDAKNLTDHGFKKAGMALVPIAAFKRLSIWGASSTRVLTRIIGTLQN
ncbi:hypothetical protein CMV_008743 [Castanea mollissima]|uniref:Uncharacterized protein n=1 Tax=Castanea mollissima TaxID=60419 RepID=A0A8J4VRK5_9ROSI|nr:hypothetical protein CMV_008743 [Castanea mollissima]